MARAYAEKVASTQTPVTDAEAVKYYNDNPDLFAQRKIYQMREIALPSNAAQVAEFKTRVEKGESLDSVAAWLKGQGAVFSANAGVKPAEQLPMALVSKLAAMLNGQNLVVNMPQAVMAVEVVNSQSRPVEQATALPQIKQFLSKQRATEAVEANLKHLRESAKIDYVGEVKPVEPAPAAKPQDAHQSEAESINKGVAGLK
jgi:hypothetical protein